MICVIFIHRLRNSHFKWTKKWGAGHGPVRQGNSDLFKVDPGKFRLFY